VGWRVRKVRCQDALSLYRPSLLYLLDIRFVNLKFLPAERNIVKVLLALVCLLAVLKLNERVPPVLEHNLDPHNVAVKPKQIEHFLVKLLVKYHLLIILISIFTVLIFFQFLILRLKSWQIIDDKDFAVMGVALVLFENLAVFQMVF